MKLDLANNFLESSQLFETTEFSIDDSAHAYELLLKNLYSDPISSTVRETISNAWDSHIAAGKADTAIIVTAPTELEPTFIVQDFGVGISPDKFRNVVTRIFCSDKTNSDDLIGGYGLGLKSPLAYTDQFIITSIIDGWLRNYSCHISESGKPMLSMFNEEATTEGNGVTIKVPVKPKDIKAFQTAIKNTLMYFSSFTCNLHIAQNSTLWENDDVQIVNTHSHYGNKLYALIGCIPYEVDIHKIIDTPRYEYQWIGSIILKFNINEVSVTPNREELNYNEKTINALNKKYNQAKAAAVKDLADKINDCATYELACKNYTRLFTTLERFNWVNDRLVSHPSKPGQGLSRFITVVFNGYEVKTLKNSRKRAKYKTTFDSHFKEKLNVDITNNLTLYWLPPKAKRILDCLNTINIDFNTNQEHLFIIGDNPQTAFKQFQELYNNPIKLNDLSLTAKNLPPRTTKTKYKTGNILTTKGPIQINEINPLRDVYIKAVDKRPIGPWTDRTIHVALDVLPDDIRYVIYNHKTHEKMLQYLAIRNFEDLATQIPNLITQNMEAIQRYKQINDKMNRYVDYIYTAKVDYNSKLITFAKLYTASTYTKDLYVLANALKIDIPDNPAITKELDTIYKIYEEFFDQNIDIKYCPKILTAYEKYLGAYRMIPYILTENSCTLLMNNKMHTIKKSTTSIWEHFIEALKKEDTDAIERVLNPTTAIETYSRGNFKIINNAVYHKGEPLHKALSDRVIRMIREGFNADPMLKFIDNLLENPSSTAINELYEFLEACDLPITPDGHFIAYKRIRDNYMDCHSGTIDNHVGCKPSMPRAKVNDDRRHTCSHGLHVCSIGYLANFGGSRLIVCKINPRDVVSIPADYQNSKMRVCQYEVIEELDMATIEAFNENLTAVYNHDTDDDDDDFNAELDYED